MPDLNQLGHGLSHDLYNSGLPASEALEVLTIAMSDMILSTTMSERRQQEWIDEIAEALTCGVSLGLREARRLSERLSH